MDRLNQDFLAFIGLLEEEGVEYLIVGGYAVGVHGFPRYTGVIDFFVALRLRPDEVVIDERTIRGRKDLSEFSVAIFDLQSIEYSRATGKGGPALFAFLKSSRRAVELPLILDEHKKAYQDALARLDPNAKLDW